MKKSIEDIQIRGKRVLTRLDLNVPLADRGRITDDRRIRAALNTARKVIDGGGRLILMSHLGRPGPSPEDRKRLSLAPVAARLQQLLGKPVPLAPDCVGSETEDVVHNLQDGHVCLLENLRFHAEETVKDKDAERDVALRDRKDEFARAIARLGDVYVNDAFGTCHRDNASMLTVPQMMEGKPRVVGCLVRKELEFLGSAVARAKHPFVCLLGGAKVSDKLGVIRSLLGRCDTVLIGGAMAYTFLAAEGTQTGRSRVEPDLFETARELRRQAGGRVQLPVDSVTATDFAGDPVVHTHAAGIPAERMGLDIGPASLKAFAAVLESARTVLWNGPMGVFEHPPFDRGTIAMAEATARATEAGAVSVIGGGDSAAAVDRAGLAERMTHISTGGGASLEFLERGSFPTIDLLDDA